MNVEQLLIFQQVAACGSFSAAAISLNTSQSAVSRAIASLEEELGIPLLSRGRFGARLTQAGERVLVHAREMLQARERMSREVNVVRGLEGGCVRVASFRSAATHLIPPLLATFFQRFPKIEVTLTEMPPLDVERALRTGEVDLGLLPLPRSEEFETWEIARDDYVVLLPGSERSLRDFDTQHRVFSGTTPSPVDSPLESLHARSHTSSDPTIPRNETLSWGELMQYSFILYNYAECTAAVRNYCAQWGRSLWVAHEIKEDSTIVSMVSQGLGAAILPRLAAIPIPENVRVCSLPAPLERKIGAAMLADVEHPPSVFVFMDLLRGRGMFATR